MNRKAWTPKQPRWALATLVLAFLAFLAYALTLIGRPLDPARGTGLVFGILATVLFIVEAVYPLRRKLLSKPLGNATRWIQLHVWGGLLAALFVFMHEGFRKPGGTMGWLLFLLTIWVTLTGLVGVVLQKWVPLALARDLTVEALFERIPDLVARLPLEADKLVDGASEVLVGFYRKEVRPALAGVDPQWSYLIDLRGGRDRRLLSFARITQFVKEDERARLEDLRILFVEKLELDAHYTAQRALRGWTALHVPPAIVLLALLFVHIGAFFLY